MQRTVLAGGNAEAGGRADCRRMAEAQQISMYAVHQQHMRYVLQ